MYRELAFKSMKLSVLSQGSIYTLFFSIASISYLVVYKSIESFISITILSIVMIYASTLSDRKNIKQLITTLILSGAKGKHVVICLILYILVRVILVLITYSYLASNFLTSYITLVISHLVNLILLSNVFYMVMK